MIARRCVHVEFPTENFGPNSCFQYSQRVGKRKTLRIHFVSEGTAESSFWESLFICIALLPVAQMLERVVDVDHV